MKLLVDMNLSPTWVDELAAAGIDAVHWSTVGSKDAPDVEIMAFAAAHGLIVLTQDLDFSAILAATRNEKPSVVQVRSQQLNSAEIGRTVILALREMAVDLAAGAVLTIDPKRIRLLPLKIPE